MISISDLFARFARSPVMGEALELPPPQAGATLAVAEYGYDTVMSAPDIVNIGAGFSLWRQAPGRTVWRVRPDTAIYLRNVGLGFLPELPPASWSGAAIIIESADKATPLVDDVFSILGYQCESMHGDVRYFFVGLRTPDGTMTFGIQSNLATINEKLAETGGLLDLDFMDPDNPLASGPPTAEHQQRALNMVRFIFAVSYYALDSRPERITITHAPGLPERDAHGKTRRQGGRPVPLWTYADLVITPAPQPENERGPLDKTGLTCSPVVVRPYVRRSESGKVSLVGAYDAHRWKHPGGRLGEKTKI